MLSTIEKESSPIKLCAMFYNCEGMMKNGKIEVQEYTDCMMLLSKKLGFGMIAKNVDDYIRRIAYDDGRQ